MKCQNCGYENYGDSRFCEKCGTFLGQSTNARTSAGAQNTNAQNLQSNYRQSGQGFSGCGQAGYSAQNYSAPPEAPNSYFDGNMWQLLGWSLLGGLITFITLGFGMPWAKVLKIRWETKHTVIKGKRLYFNGTAPQLFGKLVLWVLLSAVILAIPLIIGIVSSSSTRSGYDSLFRAAHFYYFDWGNMILSIVLDLPFALLISTAFEIYIKRWQTKHTTFIEDKGIAYNHMSDGRIYYESAQPTARATRNFYNTQVSGGTGSAQYGAQSAAPGAGNYAGSEDRQ